jgi:hypothetical protein
VSTKDDLRLMRDYLALVYGAAKKAYAAGASEQEATASINLGEYAEWGDAERLPINVSRCYAEFRGDVKVE